MEEPLSVHQLDQPFNTLGVRLSAGNANSNKNDDVPLTRPLYSMPGILHFLQTEWAKFEMDRAQWEIDKAELQVRRKNSAQLC
ncbi:hypothetical protein HELRODRAFT_80964 [Helobdella robusta]|uniref:Striatin N-terminal domain-containing protein n=1 Tax=Helobdella robusta TaxID=6412 RepID=T1G476_HELRO|nr:hypothetical protein HELRODRAFT_80964 [Helobdella robusta]ESO03119.1 hypothetical protein HELRODRAFT_80964 [Helobdella robusta]